MNKTENEVDNLFMKIMREVYNVEFVDCVSHAPKKNMVKHSDMRYKDKKHTIIIPPNLKKKKKKSNNE